MIDFDLNKKDFTFDEDKANEIETFCTAIYNNSRKANTVDRRQDTSRTSVEVNLQGMAAEIWFKEKYSLPYTLDVNSPDTQTRSYTVDIDAQVDDLIFEIKQTAYDNGCLFVRHNNWVGKNKELKADVFVLIVGKFPNYDRNLFISREKFEYLNSVNGKLTHTIHKKIGKHGYHVEQEDMYPTLTEARAWQKEKLETKAA
tara:strand:- start:3976 stop:4575 length:600 start_codon:yes stop_codon:yes gene_type:complete